MPASGLHTLPEVTSRQILTHKRMLTHKQLLRSAMAQHAPHQPSSSSVTGSLLSPLPQHLPLHHRQAVHRTVTRVGCNSLNSMSSRHSNCLSSSMCSTRNCQSHILSSRRHPSSSRPPSSSLTWRGAWLQWPPRGGGSGKTSSAGSRLRRGKRHVLCLQPMHCWTWQVCRPPSAMQQRFSALLPLLV